MVNNETNTVTLTKSAYDSMQNTNDRANMLLREIMSAMSITMGVKHSRIPRTQMRLSLSTKIWTRNTGLAKLTIFARIA